jgi:putative RNA 2'-phosphotransferase
MDDRWLVKTSKHLSLCLRHHPERLGLTVERGGWVRVDDLLRACAEHGFALTMDELREVVERNDKRRFGFDATGTRIRANQGHSIDVDLQLTPASPPAVLYHGTARAALDAILREGLHRMGRHHVHLSPDVATARRVGARHGRPVVLEVAAGRMAGDGHVFYLTDNGVWLTADVPAECLRALAT